VDTSLLFPLMDTVPCLSVPCEVHPEVWMIDSSTDDWARATGLVTGDPDSSPLGRARFGRLAARVFPDAPRDRVELFSRWLTWLYAFDDARDNTPLGASATSVDTVYAGLMMAIRRGHARPEAGPPEMTLVELWNGTAALMSHRWRQRFLSHLEDHRRACTEEAVHRRTGRVPSMADYAALRRRSGGMWAYDLGEPVLGLELPDDVLRSPGWQSLQEAVADLVAWSNDVVSHPLESANGAHHNFLTVLAETYGLETDRTGVWVVERLARRASDLTAAARQLPATFRRLELAPEETAQAETAAKTLLTLPRAHLEWLLESGRYSGVGVRPEERREPLLRMEADGPRAPSRRRVSSRSPSPTGW
jgi:hypothetical protein